MLYSFIEYGLLLIICAYLVNYYSSKAVSFQVKIWSVITWVLNFGLALLVPQDVYQTLQGQPDPDVNSSLGFQYLVLYWSVYLLTWTIIPVLQEWDDAGDIDSYDRLKRSLRSNGIFYLVMIVGAVIFLIILILLDVGGQMGLITFLKCLATIWGIFLLMILLGYSLVEIPKTMWRNADPNDYLLYIYQRVIETGEQIDDSISDFKKIVGYIIHVKKVSRDDKIQQYCRLSLEMIPPALKSSVNQNYDEVLKKTGYFDEYPICLESSIEHNRLIKRGIARCRRQERAQLDYIRQAIFYEDVIQAIQNNQPLRTHVKKVNAIQELWYVKVRRNFNKVGSIFIGICSFIILLSETQVFLTSQSSILSLILSFKDLQMIRFMVFFVISFIIYMSNYALFRLKLANLYGLYHKESDGASLMFATVNFSRIGVAIVLNFFEMIKMENSIYSNVMQAPQMGLLGEWVIKGLPGVLWLIVLCHYFNVWGYLAKKMGFDDSFSFSSHQIDKFKIKSPAKVVEKRRELQRNHSDHILQSDDPINF